jgi:hypothetical protein
VNCSLDGSPRASRSACAVTFKQSPRAAPAASRSTTRASVAITSAAAPLILATQRASHRHRRTQHRGPKPRPGPWRSGSRSRHPKHGNPIPPQRVGRHLGRPSATSQRRSLVSSLWIASSSNASSRRPVQVVRSWLSSACRDALYADRALPNALRKALPNQSQGLRATPHQHDT